MKVGYVGINLSLDCRSSRTFRLRSYSDDKMKEIVQNNLDCLKQILRFNKKHGIFLFRITSALIPFASHPVQSFPWQRYFQDQFADIGQFARENDMRLTMHPDQFILINSNKKDVVERSVAELNYHDEVLHLLGMDESCKIQIHIGGVYNDKEKAIEKFAARYDLLPENVKKRLVIENDERFSVSDCLGLNKKIGVPIVYDALHNKINSSGFHLSEVFQTWKKGEGLPLIDYSSQRKNGRVGAHSEEINRKDFENFWGSVKGYDFDLTFEVKNKEQSVLWFLENFIKK